MIKATCKFLLSGLVLATSVLSADVGNDMLPTTFLEKGGSFIKPKSDKKRNLYLTVHSIQATGNFSFRIVIVFPNGKIYKSQVFNSATIPSTPFKLKTFESCPVGAYLVHSQVVDVQTPGSGLVIVQAQNSWNDYVSAAQVFVQGDSTFLDQRVLSSAISFP